MSKKYIENLVPQTCSSEFRKEVNFNDEMNKYIHANKSGNSLSLRSQAATIVKKPEFIVDLNHISKKIKRK